MIETIQNLNHTLSLFGFAAIFATVFLLYDVMTKRVFAPLISRWGLHLALLVTVIATILTLVYSEVFGILPCGLCWLERMALYPQVLLILVALYLRDKHISRYGIALSVFGLVVSLYHHYIQMGGSQFVKCPAAGADCAKRFFFEYGFVTFPLMSAILFVFLIALYFYIFKLQRN